MIAFYRKVNKSRTKDHQTRAGTNKKQEKVPCSHQTVTTQDGGTASEPIVCPQCKEEKRTARVYRTRIILGLILPFALQALDVTIVASALPFIAIDFGEVSQLNWIISAFNLTSAAFIPFWAQLADIFGRHLVLQSCLLLMLLGSALCTGAPTTTSAFGLFLLGRAVQGVACAGIGIVVRVIIADRVSLAENARNWTIFAMTGGLAYGVGPVVGGFLTARNWRWCFAINLPIAVVGIVVVFVVLRGELLGPQPIPELDEEPSGRRQRFSRRIMTVDVGGQLLFLFGFGLLILAFTWAGATYDWNTVAVLVPLVVGAFLIIGWIAYECLMAPGSALGNLFRHQKPMVPFRILRDRNIGLLFYVNFSTGMAMYSVLYFCDLYFTIVKMQTASQAGVQLLFYTPGIGIGTYFSMFFTNIWPRKTYFPLLLGSVIEAVGVGFMANALYYEHTPTIFGMMALTGAGTGLRMMPGGLHAVGFFPQNIATVVALMGIAMPLGGTLALTIMSTVFNNTSGIARDSPLRDFSTLASLPPDLLEQVRNSAKNGITWAFVALTPFMVVCVFAALGLGNVTILKGSNAGVIAEGRGAELTHGCYLLSLLRGGGRDQDRVDVERVPVGERVSDNKADEPEK